MNRKYKYVVPLISFIVLSGLQLSGLTAFAQAPGPGQRLPLPPIPIKGDTTHTLSKHFTTASAAKKAPGKKPVAKKYKHIHRCINRPPCVSQLPSLH